MRIEIKKCRTCGALGVGPSAVKLFPVDGQLYCQPHFGKSLDWAVNREAVIQGLESLVHFQQDVRNVARVAIIEPKKVWRAYIEEQAGMAAEALVMGDRRTFVYYFSRALWAWELSRDTR